MSRSLTDFKVLAFDCYGTLIDWETGIWDAGQPVLMANRCGNITRPIWLNAFAEAESAQQVATPSMPYPEILFHTHRAMAGKFELKTTDDLDRAFGDSVPHWPAFPDTADALRQLQNHFQLAILSNVDQAGFAASNRKLGVEFQAIYTAEDVGSYKPNPENFSYMLERLDADLGLVTADILHTAQSLFHDIVEASQLGLTTAWIDRQRLSAGGDWGATAIVPQRPDPDFLFHSMNEMAVAVAAEN